MTWRFDNSDTYGFRLGDGAECNSTESNRLVGHLLFTDFR